MDKSKKVIGVLFLLSLLTVETVQAYNLRDLVRDGKQMINRTMGKQEYTDEIQACTEKDSAQETLTFDHQNMVYEKGENKVEGYWASSQDPLQDGYHGKYPFPKKYTHPWLTQDEFLKRLAILTEKAAKNTFLSLNAAGLEEESVKYRVIGYRGLSLSRLEPGVPVGSREYVYRDLETGKEIHWTEAFGPYYVAKFNVKPSKEFYDWVMNNHDAQTLPARL